MLTIGIVAGVLYAPGLLIGGGAWIASRLSPGARRWMIREMFGEAQTTR